MFPADTADDKQMRLLFAAIKKQFGHLDFVFANAGVNGVWAPIEQLKPKEWDDTIRNNLRGTYLTVHLAVPLMKKRGGSIVITSSINGTRTFTSAGASAYSTTKAGRLALGQMLALELAEISHSGQMSFARAPSTARLATIRKSATRVRQRCRHSFRRAPCR